MATVLITGGTGMIGRKLSWSLAEKGYDVVILTRNARDRVGKGRIQYAEWSVEGNYIDENAFSRADYVVHLAGAGIADKRWTAKRKKQIRESRIRSGDLLVQSLARIPNHIKAIISASGIGWYGPDQKQGMRPFKETDDTSSDFLGQTCRLWEASLIPATKLTRVVWLRTGIVLGRDGGALPEFLKFMKLEMVPVLGGGKQIVSWIHIEDLVDLFIYTIEKAELKGAFNAVAPQPVSHKEMMLAIADSFGKGKIILPVPSLFPKLLKGELSKEVLKSATVSADKIIRAGFRFKFPAISEALADLAAHRREA